MPSQHAEYAPSSYERWNIHSCSASIEEAPRHPPRPGSSDAEAGTEVHDAVERVFQAATRIFKDGDCQPKKIDAALAQVTDIACTEFDRCVENGMTRRLASVGLGYCEALAEITAKRRAEHSLAVLKVEQRVYIRGHETRVWGTADGQVWTPALSHIDIVDLKTGAGIFIPADYGQLKVYALGSASSYYKEYGVWPLTVTVHVYQPLLNEGHELNEWGCREHTWTIDDLMDLQNDIDDVWEARKKGELRFRPSPKACRFCDALPFCKAAQMAIRDPVEAGIMEFDPKRINHDKLGPTIAELLPRAQLAQQWADSVIAASNSYARIGLKIPGYKLVQGRKARNWNDEKKVQAWLKQHGVDPYNEPKLRSPAQAEEHLTKDLGEKLNELFVDVSYSDPKLVPDDEKSAKKSEVKVGARFKAAQLSADLNRMKGVATDAIKQSNT